jgi:hypothetical protein
MLTNAKRSTLLPIFIIAMTFISAVLGLALPDLFRDISIDKYMIGNDWITLLIAIPVFTVSYFFMLGGSARAKLTFIGMLYFTTYNFSFYLFATTLNWMFVFNVTLFTLPIFVIIFELTKLDTVLIASRLNPKIPAKRISIFMLVFVLCLVIVWSMQWITFMSTGAQNAKEGRYIQSVAGLDLSILAPFMILGAVWLWKKNIWGYVMSVILNLSNAVYMTVLCTNSILETKAGVTGAASDIVIWVIFGAGSLWCTIALLRNLNTKTA